MTAPLLLTLTRRERVADATIGEMRADSGAAWLTLEDVVRPKGAAKVRGRTAIPAGEYAVQVTWSPRFQQPMPLLLDVPNFSGVRIHPGNTAEDTDGCILVGLTRRGASIARSREAYRQVLAAIGAAEAAGRPVRLRIVDALP